jgi:hypothetical protein
MASEGMILVRTSDLNEWGDESHSLFPPRIKAKAGSLQGLLSIISSWKKNFQFLFTGDWITTMIFSSSVLIFFTSSVLDYLGKEENFASSLAYVRDFSK